MSDTLVPVQPEIAAAARINAAQFAAMTARVAADPAGFWSEQADRIAWMRPPTKTVEGDFHGDVRVTWYEDGTLNASVSCLSIGPEIVFIRCGAFSVMVAMAPSTP